MVVQICCFYIIGLNYELSRHWMNGCFSGCCSCTWRVGGGMCQIRVVGRGCRGGRGIKCAIWCVFFDCPCIEHIIAWGFVCDLSIYALGCTNEIVESGQLQSNFLVKLDDSWDQIFILIWCKKKSRRIKHVVVTFGTMRKKSKFQGQGTWFLVKGSMLVLKFVSPSYWE